MKIYGIGTDIVKCERILALWQNNGMAFAKRILSSEELAKLEQMPKNQVAYLAKRFAAKEAVVKAIGTGFREDVMLTQIAIDTNEWGKPSVEFLAKTAQYIESIGKLELQVSIADEEDYVVAFAIAIEE